MAQVLNKYFTTGETRTAERINSFCIEDVFT